MLIDNNSVDIFERSLDGKTPLEYASKNTTIFKLLKISEK
jgi:hypothetical protein